MKKEILEDPRLLTNELVHSILILNNKFMRPRHIGRKLRISSSIIRRVLTDKFIRTGVK